LKRLNAISSSAADSDLKVCYEFYVTVKSFYSRVPTCSIYLRRILPTMATDANIPSSLRERATHAKEIDIMLISYVTRIGLSYVNVCFHLWISGLQRQTVARRTQSNFKTQLSRRTEWKWPAYCSISINELSLKRERYYAAT